MVGSGKTLETFIEECLKKIVSQSLKIGKNLILSFWSNCPLFI